ncbi:Uncharacterised protein at_DN0004 [Pycnogonum litorale]
MCQSSCSWLKIGTIEDGQLTSPSSLFITIKRYNWRITAPVPATLASFPLLTNTTPIYISRYMIRNRGTQKSIRRIRPLRVGTFALFYRKTGLIYIHINGIIPFPSFCIIMTLICFTFDQHTYMSRTRIPTDSQACSRQNNMGLHRSFLPFAGGIMMIDKRKSFNFLVILQLNLSNRLLAVGILRAHRFQGMLDKSI